MKREWKKNQNNTDEERKKKKIVDASLKECNGGRSGQGEGKGKASLKTDTKARKRYWKGNSRNQSKRRTQLWWSYERNAL